jgi:hypothetical protein
VPNCNPLKPVWACILSSLVMAGTFNEEASNLVRNAFCAVAGNAPTLPRLFNRFAPGLLVPVEGTGGTLYAFPPFFDFPEFLYRSVCNREPPPRPPAPIDGGQCECAIYEVTTTVLRFSRVNFVCETSNFQQGPIPMYGPLLAARIRQIGGSQWVAEINCRGLAGPGSTCGAFEWVVANNFTSSQFCDPPEIISITPVPAPGEPNDCGDSPLPIGPLPPGGNTFIQNNFIYTDNSGADINLGDVNVTVETPRIDIDGRVNIPVRLNFSPNVRVNASLNVNGEVNFFPQTGPGRGSGDKTPEDTAPIEPPPPPPIGIPNLPADDDEPSEVEVIVGALVTSTPVGPNNTTETAQDINPDLLLPDVGVINFLIRVESGATGWTTDIRLKNARQVVECPWPFGAIDVLGTPRPGWVQTITPIRDTRQDIQEVT